MPPDHDRLERRPATPQRSGRVGLLLVLASAAGFSTLGVLGKQAYAGGMGVADVLVVRFLVAAPVLWLLVLALRRRAPRRPLRVPWATALRLAALGATGYVLQAVLFLSAVTRISPGLASLLLYVYPALVAGGAAALGRQRLDRGVVASLALALAGTVLVLGLPSERLDALGVALGLGAAACYTIYLLVGEYLVRGVDPLVASAWIVTGSCASFVVVGAGALRLVDLGGARPGALLAGAAMGVVATAIPVAALFLGMVRIGSTWASIASSFEPVFTVALSVAVLGERLGPGKLLGGAAVVAGAMLLPLLRKPAEGATRYDQRRGRQRVAGADGSR